MVSVSYKLIKSLFPHYKFEYKNIPKNQGKSVLKQGTCVYPCSLTDFYAIYSLFIISQMDVLVKIHKHKHCTLCLHFLMSIIHSK